MQAYGRQEGGYCAYISRNLYRSIYIPLTHMGLLLELAPEPILFEHMPLKDLFATYVKSHVAPHLDWGPSPSSYFSLSSLGIGEAVIVHSLIGSRAGKNLSGTPRGMSSDLMTMRKFTVPLIPQGAVTT